MATVSVISITLDPRLLADAIKRLGPERFRQNLAGGLREGSQLTERVGKLDADRQVNDTGKYRDSLQILELTGTGFSFGTRISYGATLEYGRRPGAKPPPPEALRGWAGRHGLPTTRGFLFVLARSIGRKGFPGRGVLARTGLMVKKPIEDILVRWLLK